MAFNKKRSDRFSCQQKYLKNQNCRVCLAAAITVLSLFKTLQYPLEISKDYIQTELYDE